MPPEPARKRAVVFVDGQNLYHSVRESFGYTYPNYDVLALARRICQDKGWDLAQVRLYTGVPEEIRVRLHFLVRPAAELPLPPCGPA